MSNLLSIIVEFQHKSKLDQLKHRRTTTANEMAQ